MASNTYSGIYKGEILLCVEWNDLAKLLCGKPEEGTSEVDYILIRLGNTITKFTDQILLFNYSEEKDRVNIPFYARSIMEAACTALVARIDPFRILITYKVQSSSDYDITKRSNAAIQWTGDIIAAGKPKAILWNPENKINDYDRALLSNYNGELFWKPAFLKTIDYVEDEIISSEWLNRFKNMDENEFFERTKTELSKLYSCFSKGIHYEFLVNAESIFDVTTLKSFVNRMFQILAEIAMVSHSIGLISGNMEYSICIKYFTDIEEMITNASRM